MLVWVRVFVLVLVDGDSSCWFENAVMIFSHKSDDISHKGEIIEVRRMVKNE